MHRPERINWKLVIDRLRPPAELCRRGPLMMPACGAGVHSESFCNASVGCIPRFCGAEETRTPDFLLAKEALYQLSYGPEAATPLRGGCAFDRERKRAIEWCRHGPKTGDASVSVAPRSSEGSRLLNGVHPREWALLDSNQRPLPYQGSALTS